ncbi:HDOD domain-containing protein [Ferrimonas aestuarii]|uniref:HDOD domain-containing protein n=1 Tax=Ferrimonas aestuarii TaxID=2569539 RepID=UPI00145D09B2|nr:HDOD domain-containing protein [Ferrimonas aestuarii]
MSNLISKPAALAELETRFWQYQSLAEPVFSAEPSLDEEIAFIWRHKLEVERAAEFKRIQKSQQRNEEFKKFRQFFGRAFEVELERHLLQPEQLQYDLGITAAQLDLLYALLSDKGDIRSLVTQLQANPEISRALMRHINSNRFKGRRGQELTSVQLAVTYIGYEKVRELLPGLIFEHWSWAPDHSQGIQQRKLWRWFRLFRRACINRLKQQGVDAHGARIYACVFALGPIIVHRQATGLFAQMRQQWMNQARVEESQDVYEGVRQLRMPCQPLAVHYEAHLEIAHRFLMGLEYKGPFLALFEQLQRPWFSNSGITKELPKAFAQVMYDTLVTRIKTDESELNPLLQFYQLNESSSG